MSIKTKIAAVAFAALVAMGGFAATASPAQAGYRGAGLGIAAGVLTGAAIASGAGYGYGYGYYRHCGWVRQFDGYGNTIGRVNTCGY